MSRPRQSSKVGVKPAGNLYQFNRFWQRHDSSELGSFVAERPGVPEEATSR